MTEINYFKNLPKYKKGVMSLILGTLLFFILPYQIYKDARNREDETEKQKAAKYREIDEKLKKI